MKKLLSVILLGVLILSTIPLPTQAQTPSPDQLSLSQMASLISSLQSILNSIKAKVAALKGSSSVSIAQAQTADITTGLVGHWKFDETSGTTAADSSGNNNTGTLTNGPTWTTGKVGGALSFNGLNQYVSVPESSAIDIRSSLSISTWVNRSTLLVHGELDMIVRKAEGSGYLYRFGQYHESGSGDGGLLFTPGAGAVHHPQLNINYGINQWHHIAVTFDTISHNVLMYIDGVQIHQSTDMVSGGYSPGTGALFIGTGADTSDFLNGSLDDLRIYNRALSSSDISALYSLGSGTLPSSDTTAPVVSLTAPTSGSTVVGSSVAVSADASDNVGVAGVQFKLDGVNLNSEDTTSPYSITWNSTTASNGSHTLSVTARDAAGNQTTSSGVTVTVSNATSDTQVPSTPTNLSASAISSSQINLSWTASTDNVGVTGYRLERCQGSSCTNFAQIGTPSTNSYSDTGGLAANTTYRYRVRAADGAGNLSSYSSIVSGTTQAATGENVLANLAASMAAGEWRELVTNNIGVLNQPGTDGNILPYGADAAWDPNTQKLMYVGNDHIDSVTSQNLRSVIYDATTNTWQNLATPPWGGAGVTDHGYYHHAVNPATGAVYRRGGKQGFQWYQYNLTTNSWATIPVNSVGEYEACCAGVDYFPELGGLVYIQGGEFGGGTVYLFNTSTQQWSKLADNLTPMTGGTFTIGAYNPVQRVMVGGQNNAFYKISSTGQVTPLANPPITLYDGGGYFTNLVADPVSGKYIVLTTTNRQLYTYDAATDTWQTQTSTNKPNFTNQSIISVPISNYGVIMYAACAAANCKVYVYKHTAGGGTPPPSDTQAPSAPTGLSTTAQSSSQINLSWSASTDNIGVTSYRVERCQGSTCTNFTQIATPTGTSYSDTGLSANTTYRYQVRAIDAAGNLSGYSSIASTTTQASTPPPTGGSDFSTRCSQPGVVKCVGFDQASDIAGTYGDNHGIFSGATTPILDSSVKASGNSALKFTIPSNSGADTSGSYFTNFSDDLSVQFGENSGFYLQWRQRFSPEFLNTNYTNSNGWKQMAVTTGDQPARLYASCEAIGVTMENTNQRGFAQMYQSCTGSTSHGPYDPLTQYTTLPAPYNRDDILLQNARLAPYCTYLQQWSLGTPTNYAPGNCFIYYPNEWMTFQVSVKTGPRVNDEFTNSYIRVWIAREGQPSQAAFDFGPYNISASTLAENQRYGKVWFLPYQTNKSSAQSHPTGYTWYDDLIISRNKIADPGSFTPPPQTLVGDLNNDRIVNSLDWSLMNAAWATNNAAADLNHDGIVNSLDFSMMNANWGRTI